MDSLTLPSVRRVLTRATWLAEGRSYLRTQQSALDQQKQLPGMTADVAPPIDDANRISIWEQLREVVDPTGYRPKQRDGLVWSRLTTVHGEEYVIIQNPQAATYLRLSVEDFFVFELMDGSLTIRDLVVAYMLKFQRFALARIARLAQELRANQFLVDPPYATFPQLRRRARRRSVGSFFDATFRLVFNREFPINGIDGVLEAAYRRGVWVLFTRPALLGMALIALTGVPLFIYYLFSQQYALLDEESVGQDVVGYYLAFLVIALAHELSHAFSVKASGRVVRRGGFAIFYGLPGLFVDTQDIWMEPRGPRIAASWAGPYSGLVLTGLVGLALTAAPQASWAPVLRLFGLAALINNVFQLMPLIPLDGYFILMDWLEIPQLRRRALMFVRHDLVSKLRRRQPFNREERIFAVFGVLAAAYTTYAVFLGSAFWWNHASSAIQSALRVPNLASLLGLVVLLLVLIPFGLGLARRVLSLAEDLMRAARRATGVARERWNRERVALIAQVPALANLGNEQAQALASHLREERLGPGAAVVRQGDRGDRFYLIADGQAEVIREGPDHSEVLGTLGPLDYFGERALLGNVPRAATVRATSKLRLLSLSTRDFKRSVAPYVGADAALRARLSERDELDHLPMFEQLGSREKDLLLSRLGTETYDAGQVIVHEGDAQDGFYCLRSGRVEVSRRDGLAEARRVDTMGVGDVFGEVALLFNTTRTATVTALEETQLWVLAKEDFHELLGHYFNLESALAEVARTRLPSTQVLLDLTPGQVDGSGARGAGARFQTGVKSG